jgi:hypothetical protein
MLVRLFSVFLFSILFVAGCTRSDEKQAEVSGKVTYKGKPVPGGRIIFVSAKGYNSTSVISPQGEYQLKAPIGEVKIGVDNHMLNKNDPTLNEKKAYLEKKGRLKPKGPLAERQSSKQEITGTYVPLPSHYANPATSGLTYTVKPGPQTFDLDLADNSSPPPGPAGR